VVKILIPTVTLSLGCIITPVGVRPVNVYLNDSMLHHRFFKNKVGHVTTLRCLSLLLLLTPQGELWWSVYHTKATV